MPSHFPLFPPRHIPRYFVPIYFSPIVPLIDSRTRAKRRSKRPVIFKSMSGAQPVWAAGTLLTYTLPPLLKMPAAVEEPEKVAEEGAAEVQQRTSDPRCIWFEDTVTKGLKIKSEKFKKLLMMPENSYVSLRQAGKNSTLPHNLTIYYILFDSPLSTTATTLSPSWTRRPCLRSSSASMPART